MKIFAKFRALAGAALGTMIAAPAFALELLVPAYFYPTSHASEWQSLIDVAAASSRLAGAGALRRTHDAARCRHADYDAL